jgi:serine/threonine protein kinase
MPSREDIELYVSGNYDGEIAALEAAIAADPALAKLLAEEAELELLLRDAAASASFCPACDDLVRGERCNSCGAAMRPGGYTVERVLVANAHGRMYVAHDADGTQVALKELAFVHAPSPAAVAAFEREAKFLRALSHPAIPRFMASFEEGQGVHTRYYLAQELVAGTPLDKLDDHWYTEAEIVDIAKQVLAIIDYLQSLSPMVIHRDIKPANLLRRTGGKQIALVDFGAAHAHDTTAGVTTIGTFGYMPIEQLAGIVDATTDLYALGASLLHLLTRQEPWKLTQSKTTVNVSAGLRAFLDKLTAPDPANRFQSAKQALAALEARDQLVSRRTSSRRTSRNGLVAIAATATVLAASGAAVYRVTRSSSSETSGTSPPSGARPESKHVFDPRVADPFDAAPRVLESQPRLAITTRLTKSFEGVPLHTAMQQFSEACGLNIVIPEHLSPSLSVDFNDVPCDQAVEVVLESNGLWYQYWPDAQLVRIAPRRELDMEAEAAAARRAAEAVADPLATIDDSLPSGPEIDLDFKDASLRDVIRIIGASAGVTVVAPDYIHGKVTIRLKGVPWEHALQATLSSHGLWYRYRANGKLLRVAPRKELDMEAEAAQQRTRAK